MSDWLETLIVVLGIILVIGLFTNGFGIFDRTYKGRWVKVRSEALPEITKRLQAANAFLDSDGMHQELEMSISYEFEKMVYRVKIPEHVFHAVEHDLILKELGIK